ncbi:MAG: hypothetical protein ACYCSN_14355 [Acidobacteriaceae bacterium]
MSTPRTKGDGFLYAIVLFCLFSFKMVVIGVGESGIRPDDLLIFIAFLILLSRGDLRKIQRSTPFNLYLGFVLLNVVSAIWNSAMGRVSPVISLFFVVRLLQYMVFYYLGYLITRSGRRISPALTWYLWILAIVVPLQMAGVIPAAGSFAGITSRAVGNTNGPYELAVVAAFLLCFLGYRLKGRLKGLVAFALILLSASRITFAATALSGMKMVFQRTKSKLQMAAAIVLLLVVGGLGFAGYSTFVGNSGGKLEVLSRLSTAASTLPVSQVAAVYANVPTYHSSADYISGEFLDAITQSVAAEGREGEVSGTIRILRWTSLIKSTLAGVGSTLIGLGPSFGSAAVDGYFVRVFIETGLFGLAAFFAFAIALLRERKNSSWPFREYVFIMLATACFIDIFVSYKPMLLLWLWHGMHQFKTKKEQLHENRLPDAG